MNDQQIIRWLWRFGHFRNPQYANGANVTEADLPNLTLSDQVVKDAVASIQSLDQNANISALKFHSRAIIPDGEIGPATRELFTLSRCGCPDYGDAVSGDATGSGPWPVPGCDPTRKNRAAEHSIRVNVNTAGCPYTDAELAEILLRARKCAAEYGLAARYILNGNKSESEISVTFASLATDEETDIGLPQDAVIGRNYFPQAGTCNQTLQGWISRSYYPSSNRITMLSCLWVHEQLGHGIGLQHTSGGIMNPSILRISPLTWKGDPHESTMRRWYGGQPVPLDDSPVTPPPSAGIPGEMRGRRLEDGTYAVDGIIGPIPASAVGKLFIVQRDGNSPIHRLIPKSEL